MSVQDSSKNFSSISNPGDKPNANDDKNSKYRKGYERTVQNCWTHVNEKTAFKAKSIRTVVPIVLGFSCKSDLNEQHDQCHKSTMQTRDFYSSVEICHSSRCLFNIYVLQSQIVILEFGYSKEGAIFAFSTTTNIITSPTRVSRLRCSDDRYSSRSGNVRCYTTVFASENVKFDDLAFAKWLDRFFGLFLTMADLWTNTSVFVSFLLMNP